MTNREADSQLKRLGRDRKWLAAATGYKVTSLYNVFTGDERDLTIRMSKAFERAFLEEERRRGVDPSAPGTGVWDLVFFSGAEVHRIDLARKRAGNKEIPSFYRDAVISFTDRLLAKESQENKSLRAAEDPPDYPHQEQ